MFVNWNTVPMTFNDSWTYLEMLGKLVTQVDTNTQNIANHETRLVNIETVEIPAIKSRLDTIEATMVTKEELDEILEDYATEAWVTENFVSAVDLESYASRVWVTENFCTKEEYEKLLKEVNRGNLDRFNAAKSNFYKISSEDITKTTHSLNHYAEFAFSIPTEEISCDGIMVNVTYTLSTFGVCSQSLYVKNVENTGASKVVSYPLNAYYTDIEHNLFAINVGPNNRVSVLIYNSGDLDTIAIDNLSIVCYTEKKVVTPEYKAELYAKADVDGDGLVNASDASLLLQFASSLGVGRYSDTDEGFRQFCEDNNIVRADGKYPKPDANLDGVCNASDASIILIYSSAVGIGEYTADADGWYKFLSNT